MLHVRLRKQAIALPGSPFFLTIKPGAPHALNIKLPAGGLSGEVGGRCSLLLTTADKVGNTCVEGGGKLQCLCTSVPQKGDVDTSPVECVVTDNVTDGLGLGVRVRVGVGLGLGYRVRSGLGYRGEARGVGLGSSVGDRQRD